MAVRLVRFAAAALVAGSGLLPLSARAAAPVDFVKAVQPIFEAHCLKCHGPKKSESGLRLDTFAGLMAGGASGPSVVAGKSAESRLILAVERKSDDVPAMPPDDEGEPLPAEAIATLRAWIDGGAPGPATAVTDASKTKPKHWSFLPIRSPEPPAVARSAWVRNAIDAFVLARLDKEKLEPSPEAEKNTLLRRVSLDLTGLPPTREELANFLADTSAGAFEKAVDRLLASPHYGEFAARHWLDLARYADSNGYTIDGPRQMWKYRDWVINALNADMPFDRFTVEQLAGDLLPKPTDEQIVATGFHRNTLVNEEGGVDPEQFRVESVIDRVNTTGSVFLGLTVGCAQCHSHKFDPISHKDYYQFFAMFNNCDEPTRSIPTPEQRQELAETSAAIAKLETELRSNPELDAGQVAWESQMAKYLPIRWAPLEFSEARSDGGATLTTEEDHSVLVTGASPDQDIYRFVAELAKPVSAMRLDVLADERLPDGGPGRGDDGQFVLSEVVLTATAGAPASTQPVKIARAIADDSAPGAAIERTFDDDRATGWSAPIQRLGVHKDHFAIFEMDSDIPSGHRLSANLVHDERKESHSTLGRFRLSVTDVPRNVLALRESSRAFLLKPVAKRTPEEREQVRIEFIKQHPKYGARLAELEKLRARQAAIQAAVPTALVLEERAKPRETHILLRGDFLRPGPEVEPGVPEVLPALAVTGRRATRLDLARWLVDGRNPLTARVVANRLWQEHFGLGLVETENDFGSQGSPPSHPELLDWLATRLMHDGWSLKKLHRLIVTSSTYRQASHARGALVAVDPRNHLLARQSRLRLDAETIRDVALTASGLLSPKVGGPSIYPPQPKGVYRFTQTEKMWTESQGADRYRRGLYIWFWRSIPDPFLITFDAPGANSTCTRRLRSNTPLQALTLANDRAMFEFAQGLARHLLAAGPADEGARLDRAFEMCLGRLPKAIERATMQSYLAEQVRYFSAVPSDAAAAVGDKRPAGATLAQAAAWTGAARVLMNLDEFITRE